MAMNLYVGNMAFSTTEDTLRQLFSQFGTVTKASLVMDRETGRPRGFAFVEMSEGGQAAIRHRPCPPAVSAGADLRRNDGNALCR